MKITILTLFPEMFAGPFSESILKRAQEKGLLEIRLVDIRDFGEGKHKVVDDRAYGGGVGMVMKVNILDAAITSVKDAKLDKDEQKVVFLDPRGEVFTQKKAQHFSHLQHLILLCGHYEGIDERARSLIDETISIGDFVLTGGEIPAMLITDAVSRLISGVLKDEATERESFQKIETGQQFLEHPQYTTPREYKGMGVPEVLVSGDHKKIEEWKKTESEKITQQHRPDLLENK
ncbi:MAG TPA: tRNA (guanosine(37)-N1)-methyltransferase TrmD [Candidatus Saccharimonadales bacterium]|nr:tRNA (guanosine(37)-N1)-methyltransferase TrmD [Candidatus Saccharimonadales bacterium]